MYDTFYINSVNALPLTSIIIILNICRLLTVYYIFTVYTYQFARNIIYVDPFVGEV